MIRYLAIAAALLLTLAAPFALRPDTRITATSPEDTLVVLTPHSESIRREFSHAFGEHTLRTRGKRAYIDWRTPGGTSEISQTIATAYFAAFKNRWRSVLKRPWSDATVGKAFVNRRLQLDDSPADDSLEEQARREFLSSAVGIGVDLSFGGGAYDFKKNSDAGYLVDSGITELEPDWFTTQIIPSAVSGEPLRDPQNRWIGNCLSSFGIVSNIDQLKRLGIEGDLTSWDDLADPRLAGAIALADPTKSGSATKAFEMLIQEKLNASQTPEYAEKFPKLTKGELFEKGWSDAFSLIQRISANARYFTDNAAKIPLDVAQGNAAAGMCIDFYGRTWNEMLRDTSPDGRSRVRYLTPLGGSSVGADPIGMFRGAPNPKLAREFIHFVLSEEGQKLWNYRADTPGGPQHRSSAAHADQARSLHPRAPETLRRPQCHALRSGRQLCLPSRVDRQRILRHPTGDSSNVPGEPRRTLRNLARPDRNGVSSGRRAGISRVESRQLCGGQRPSQRSHPQWLKARRAEKGTPDARTVLHQLCPCHPLCQEGTIATAQVSIHPETIPAEFERCPAASPSSPTC